VRVIWSGPAVADLDSIDDWLSQHASSEIATRTFTKIRARADFLADFPHSGRPFENQRILSVYSTPFLIFYQIVQDEIQIVRIRHEREDWQVEI
jgi:toxin ParE1/3/4